MCQRIQSSSQLSSTCQVSLAKILCYVPIGRLKISRKEFAYIPERQFFLGQVFCAVVYRSNGIRRRECILPFIYYDELSTSYPCSLRVQDDRCFNSIIAKMCVFTFISKISSRLVSDLVFPFYDGGVLHHTTAMFLFHPPLPRNVPYGNTVP